MPIFQLKRDIGSPKMINIFCLLIDRGNKKGITLVFADPLTKSATIFYSLGFI